MGGLETQCFSCRVQTLPTLLATPKPTSQEQPRSRGHQEPTAPHLPLHGGCSRSWAWRHAHRDTWVWLAVWGALPRGHLGCLWQVPFSDPQQASCLLPPLSSARPWGAGLELPATECHQPPCCPSPLSTSIRTQPRPCAYTGAGAQHSQKCATSNYFSPHILANSFGPRQGTSHPDPEIWGFSAQA